MTFSLMIVVYIAAFIQGAAFVCFPALSSIFTSSDAFNFSSTHYSGLFVPQAILSIIASLLNHRITIKWGIKRIFFAGMACNCVSMLLLTSSYFIVEHKSFSFVVLLFSTSLVGLGFGFTIPSLNTLCAFFFNNTLSKKILYMNSFIGIGTLITPVVLSLLARVSYWYQLPLFYASMTIILLGVIAYFPFPHAIYPLEKTFTNKISFKFCIFLLFAFMYGIVETLIGNWGVIYMSSLEGATLCIQALALTTFWSLMTIGRISLAFTAKLIGETIVYRLFPWIVGLAFTTILVFSPNSPYMGIFAFGLAGLGCSALLPLTVSFGSSQIDASINGWIIGAYLIGYGITAFFVGPLQDHAGYTLSEIYVCGVIISILLAGLSWMISKHYPGKCILSKKS